jgi:hypothetical protein
MLLEMEAEVRVQRAIIPQSESACQAFAVLSDGAFRVYFHFCSTAALETRKHYCTYDSLASSIGRGKRSVPKYLAEMQAKGVCLVSPATNQHGKTEIEICEPYWPFEKTPSESINDLDFVESVRALLLARACVTTQFQIHEQNLVNSFRLQGISLLVLERAIHLGCARRYLHLLTTESRARISSFFYFKNLVSEVTRAGVSDDYWEYISYKLQVFEEKWKSSQKAA